ncbi:MAG: sigma-70 family RNA polymerase sigma factor [Acidobacteria bacterium]|nr:sigma-70 family RNA polymerase sigma factor [Acidobacteriota bacterium]MCB9399430.1 sigma-70 family RNA polymerase sigma factor [Acidobacteriota bacterium]
MTHGTPALTELLHLWEQGDSAAFNQIFSLVYPELNRIVSHKMDHYTVSIQTTDCLHEAYLRLMDQRCNWHNRGQFFAIAAKVICRVLADHARQGRAKKRGAGVEHVSLDEPEIQIPCGYPDWILFDMALEKLEIADPAASRAFQLRNLAGFSLEETATSLGISIPTVGRHVRFAKAFLATQIPN